MSLTSTSICNSALTKLGAERILSLDADNNRAKLCKEQYEKLRDDLLYGHPWNFAIKRTSLAASVTAPVSDFTYSYPLPSDCLRVVETDMPKDAEWQVEGRNLVCDYDTVVIKYISRIEDEAQFTPGFAEVLACKIAAELAYALTQNSTVQAAAENKYTMALRVARSFDAQESNGMRVYADTWLNSRS